jgi:hypothetical protein
MHQPARSRSLSLRGLWEKFRQPQAQQPQARHRVENEKCTRATPVRHCRQCASAADRSLLASMHDPISGFLRMMLEESAYRYTHAPASAFTDCNRYPGLSRTRRISPTFGYRLPRPCDPPAMVMTEQSRTRMRNPRAPDLAMAMEGRSIDVEAANSSSSLR